MQLPTLQMRQSAISLGTERNTKNKLNNLSEKLDELQAEVHNTRMDTHVPMELFRNH